MLSYFTEYYFIQLVCENLLNFSLKKDSNSLHKHLNDELTTEIRRNAVVVVK